MCILINKENIKRIMYYIPLILVYAFIPIFLYVAKIDLNGVFFEYWTGEKAYYDLFAYNRSVLLITLSVIFIIFIPLFIFRTNTLPKRSRAYFLLLSYFIFVVLSVIRSSFLSVSLFGFVDRFEGGIVLVGYILCCLYAFIFVNDKYDILILLYPLIASSCIIGLIGILQFFNYDIIQQPFLFHLIAPREITDIIDTIIKPLENNFVYATLYNPNNVGSYTSMLMPLSFGLFLIAEKKVHIYLTTIYTCIMFAVCVGCRSRGGLIASCLAVFVLLYFFRTKWMIHKSKLLIFIPFLLIFLLMDFAADGALLNKFRTLSPTYEKNLADERSINFNDIIFDDNHVQIITDIGILNLEYNRNDNVFLFYDKNHMVLSTEESEEYHQFLDNSFKDCKYKIMMNDEEYQLILLKMKNAKMCFFIDETGVYLVGTHSKIYNKIEDVDAIGFVGNEQFASGRGYIWSRSLPLLKDTILLGHGPDTFPMYFPQKDFIGKLNSFGNIMAVVDKPHNFYIQTAHNTGLLSLVALLFLFIIYLIQSVRLYGSAKSDCFFSRAGIIITCVVLGYLTAAVFFDSVIYVAPVFWTFLGSGLAVNHIVKKNQVAGQNDNLRESKEQQ